MLGLTLAYAGPNFVCVFVVGGNFFLGNGKVLKSVNGEGQKLGLMVSSTLGEDTDCRGNAVACSFSLSISLEL